LILSITFNKKINIKKQISLLNRAILAFPQPAAVQSCADFVPLPPLSSPACSNYFIIFREISNIVIKIIYYLIYSNSVICFVDAPTHSTLLIGKHLTKNLVPSFFSVIVSKVNVCLDL
jgi:hypothetical protein